MLGEAWAAHRMTPVPAPGWPVLASCPSSSALLIQGAVPGLGWAQTGMGAALMAQLYLALHMSWCVDGSLGWGWHEHGGALPVPLGCILPCWPWGCGGQEQLSAPVLGILLCAW